MTVPFQSPIAPLEAARSAGNDEAAKQLESYFLRRILAEVKVGQSGMLSGGFAGETFQQMFNEAIADAMADAGGMGISNVIMDQLDGAAEELAARPAASRGLGATGSAIVGAGLEVPVAGRESSPFGSRIHPVTGKRKFHAGLDIAAASGTQVSAAAAGTVVRAERAGGYGNLVVVRHEGGLETRYAHLSTIDVAVGDKLDVGALVGKVGATGTATGPHLHFEVRREGVAKDPKHALNPTELLTSHKMQKNRSKD